MTIYDLSEAIRRHKAALMISTGALLALVLFLSFTWTEDGLGWRLGPRYESAVQMAVVPKGLDNLALAELDPDGIYQSAGLYAELLQSTEAFVGISDAIGEELADDIRVTVSDRAPTFEVVVTASTQDKAVGAAEATAAWLEQRLQLPLQRLDLPTQTTTPPEIRLTGPIDTVFVLIPPTTSAFPDDRKLFLSIDTGLTPAFVVPLYPVPAPGISPLPVTALAGGSVLISLQDEEGAELDSTRVPLGILPSGLIEAPDIELSLRTNPLEIVPDPDAPEVGATTLAFTEDALRLEWGELADVAAAEPTVQSLNVDVLLLTRDPVPVPIGERRGPIVLIAAFTVGIVLIIALIITVDTWQQEKLRTQPGADGVGPTMQALRLGNRSEEMNEAAEA